MECFQCFKESVTLVETRTGQLALLLLRQKTEEIRRTKKLFAKETCLVKCLHIPLTKKKGSCEVKPTYHSYGKL